jgi:hypothetical protein
MGAHITLGVLIMLQGPLQFWLNPPVHKITGMIYVAECALASVCGITFIALTNYEHGISKGLVGGVGMTIAFSTFGIIFFISSILTAIYGFRKDKISHREWALRTYVMGVSSFFYRVLYYAAFFFGYTIRQAHRYEDFARPLDQAFNWLFFVPGLIILECIIRFVKPFTSELEEEAERLRNTLYTPEGLTESDRIFPYLQPDPNNL